MVDLKDYDNFRKDLRKEFFIEYAKGVIIANMLWTILCTVLLTLVCLYANTFSWNTYMVIGIVLVIILILTYCITMYFIKESVNKIYGHKN